MPKTKKKTDRQSAIRMAKQYVAHCNELGLPIKKALLFGSYSNGSAHQYSDIDLILVSDKFINNTLHNWKLLAPITAKLFDVEPHPYPLKKFLAGDPFIDEIKRTGIEIKL